VFLDSGFRQNDGGFFSLPPNFPDARGYSPQGEPEARIPVVPLITGTQAVCQMTSHSCAIRESIENALAGKLSGKCDGKKRN
jgi:hypothetical protein